MDRAGARTARKFRIEQIAHGVLGLIAFVVLLIAEPAHAARRALVIGNDKYLFVTELKKAVNDANAMERELKAAGFEVSKYLDLTDRAQEQALGRFSKAVRGGDEVVLFFAGHGVQIRSGSYLLPIDIQVTSEREVEKFALGLQDLMDVLAVARPAFTMIIVDACRDNPLNKIAGRSVGTERGLIPAEPAKGQLVIYSAGKGQSALDRLSDADTDPNGVFTRELLKRIRQPGIAVRDLIEEVQDSVERLARTIGHEQRPAVYSEARGNFYFYDPIVVPVPPISTLVVPASSAFSAAQEESKFWDEAKAIGTSEGFQAYLDQYPTGKYAGLAKAHIKGISQEQAAVARLVPESMIGQDPKSALRTPPEAIPSNQNRVEASIPARSPPMPATVSSTPPITTSTGLITATVETVAHSTPIAIPLSSTATTTKAESTIGPIGKEPAMSPTQTTVQGKASTTVPPGGLIRDCEHCPDLVVVPAGSFVMGSGSQVLMVQNALTAELRRLAGGSSSDYEFGRYQNEGPQHTVTIKSFAVGRFEVTFAQWDSCVKSGGCDGYKPDDEGWGRDNRPVINVSWDDAQQYVGWLSHTTGKTYRLLTEAEWEYAARAGATGPYSFGDNEGRLGDHAWSLLNSGGKTHAVGEKQMNAFGLYDMHGNAWEWVEDCWNDSYSGAPSAGSAWLTGSCTTRVYRGGSWNYRPRQLRSAYRTSADSSTRESDQGFRVARNLP